MSAITYTVRQIEYNELEQTLNVMAKDGWKLSCMPMQISQSVRLGVIFYRVIEDKPATKKAAKKKTARKKAK